MKYYVGIDLGGTNIVAGVVDETYKILSKASVKTNMPRPSEKIMDDMVSVTHQAVKEAGLNMDQIECVGIGSPGIADIETGYIEYANNLDFNHVPMGDYLKKKLNKPVYVENDANAAAYGEFVAGAAKGTKNAVCITLGTGVGGGIVINNHIYSGFNHAGAELGHNVIVADGEPCTCGRKGCLEAYASASALIRMTREGMESNKDSLMWKLSEEEGKVSGRTAFAAMRQGDAAAKAVCDQYIHYLAVGVANAINTFMPEVVCIGGGVCNEGDPLMVPLREQALAEVYTSHIPGFTKNPRIVKAELGNDAGLIGAAFLGQSGSHE